MNITLTVGARLSTLLFILLFCSTVFAGSTKVEVCHVPPDDPENFHTITINANALPSHLAHGDLGEACNALCAALCDDGNACTIDDSGDCELNGCPTNPEQVDCDDYNECTADSCDPSNGCANTPRLGEACDDGAVCTGPDACNANGECTGSAIDSCCLGNEDCSQNLCDQAECNTDTNRCGNNPVVCNPASLCDMSVCAPDTGDCVDSPIVCGEGFECNPDNGACEVTVECPCFDKSTLQNLGTIGQCVYDASTTGVSVINYTNGNLACSGTGCTELGNPGCGFKNSSTGQFEQAIDGDEDDVCRALIGDECQLPATQAAPGTYETMDLSIPLLPVQ